VSERLLQRLSNGGRTGVFLGALVILLVALFAPGIVGAVLIVVIVAGLAVLMRRTWPVAPPQARVTRVAILAILLVLAVYKALH
jgi:hypothetical protein